MTRETLEWLRWLVASQSVQVGASDARAQATAAWLALAEIDVALDGLRLNQEVARASALTEDAASA